jgi:hypothetical protein
MESIENLIFGDPVYDCKGRVVRRNFGIKNIVIILAIVYGLYSLRRKMAIKSRVKSGRGKLRGGGAREVLYSIGRFFKNLGIAIGYLIAAIIATALVFVFVAVVGFIFGF